MAIYVSLLFAIVGLLIYAFSGPNIKVSQIGFAMFWTGILAFLLQMPPHVAQLFR